ncbi:MAG TPA: NAD(P)/FAD-dependent oxidoreductase [Solirubrobacteraceae bacterium]|nr:NAD(P)/FAD-dependent oxidoreductase [Solirubrobacteraceae bacterium]
MTEPLPSAAAVPPAEPGAGRAPLRLASNGASREELRAALGEAHLPTVLAVLAHVTGEDRWLRPPYAPTPPRGAEDHDSAGLPEEVQAEVREAALELICDLREGRREPAPAPSVERVAEILHVSLGANQEISPDYGPLLASELGVIDLDVEIPHPPSAADFRVLIIGSGFSGLCAAIKLARAGLAYTILEKNPTVGGTWLENTYPGCAVDTPSHLYSLSFAQRPDWSHYFAQRGQLYRYVQELADEYDVRRHVRFEHEVTTATWEEDEQRWRVEAKRPDGTLETFYGNAMISGVGFLNRPAYPDIPGLDEFDGPVMHTARWRADVPIEGRRVAVIGTGASAMQLVPSIAGVASKVTVFQRSPQWGLPHPNHGRPVSAGTQLLMREMPWYLGWYRLRLVWNFGDRLYPALQMDPQWEHPERAVNAMNDRHREYLTKYIESELGDRVDELREKCVPKYPPYGKRPLLDNHWFSTMTRQDVELVTDAVTEVRPEGVVTAHGTLHEVDVLVLATGFQAVRLLGPMEIRGRSGARLSDTWGEDDARAYLGVTVPDFPSFFFLLGPNTFAGHGGSAALSIEMQTRYTIRLLAAMLERGASSVECRPEVHQAYGEEIDDALSRTIWAHQGFSTYYRNKFGRIVVPMPWTNLSYWYMTAEPNLGDFHLHGQ